MTKKDGKTSLLYKISRIVSEQNWEMSFTIVNLHLFGNCTGMNSFMKFTVIFVTEWVLLQNQKMMKYLQLKIFEQ